MKIWKGKSIVDVGFVTTLGIESSCDDTAVAVVRSGPTGHEVLSNVVVSHCMQDYGGVVPEFAARSHVDCISGVMRESLREAGKCLDDINLIGFTVGPGLIGGLMVSTVFGKTLASVMGIPCVAINHLEGHILSAMIECDLDRPYLALLLTGGHSQIVLVNGVGDYSHIGGTVDDAVGETFDKVARMLGLGYPGGSAVEQMAVGGDPARFDFPRAMLNSNSCDFSCSGLKTAVKLVVDRMAKVSEGDVRDICASFQACIGDMLVAKLSRACSGVDVNDLVIVGGVAANKFIRKRLEDNFGGYNVVCPSRAFCSDNGAMIAVAAYKKLQKGMYSGPGALPDPSLPLGHFSLD